MLVLVLVGLVVWQRPWSSGESADEAVGFPDDAATQLTARAGLLSAATTAAQLSDAMGPGDSAQRFGREIFAARESITAPDTQWRYVTGGDAPAFDDGSGRATFDLRWGTDDRARVDLRVVPGDDGELDLTAVVAAQDPLPIWLAGALSDDVGDGTRIVRLGETGPDVTAMVRVARGVVDDVLPGTDETLTIVVPDTQIAAAAVLGRASASIDEVAAVAMLRDERDGALQGPVVVLNPARFEAMDERASQIVITHEAVHVLTRSVGTGIDLWVAEGFADFIALRDDTAPLATSAGQILRQVRQDGPPDQLPGDAEFADSRFLGGVYESAWLAMRSLADRHGEAAVIEFYASVLAGTPTDAAARDVFDETVEQITEEWQDDLIAMASTL